MNAHGGKKITEKMEESVKNSQIPLYFCVWL